eukprot:Skav212306  [mRNA]  locus=scaffold732:742448:743277:- [translate_table: standard]
MLSDHTHCVVSHAEVDEGHLADVYGRRPVFVLTFLCAIVEILVGLRLLVLMVAAGCLKQAFRSRSSVERCQ